ncbi:hypothetical protein SCUP234_09957 [Seiridium cupressi]
MPSKEDKAPRAKAGTAGITEDIKLVRTGVLCNGELATYSTGKSHNPRNNAPNSLPVDLNEVADALYALNDLQLKRDEPIHPLSLTYALRSLFHNLPDPVQSQISIPNASLFGELFGEASTEQFEALIAKKSLARGSATGREFWHKIRQKEYVFWPIYTSTGYWSTVIVHLERSDLAGEFDTVTDFALVDASRHRANIMQSQRASARVRQLLGSGGMELKSSAERQIWVPVQGDTWESGIRSFQLIRQLVLRVTDNVCNGLCFQDSHFFSTPTSGWLDVDFVRHEMIGMILERCNHILDYSCRYALEPIQDIRLEGKGQSSPDCLAPRDNGKMAYVPKTDQFAGRYSPNEEEGSDADATDGSDESGDDLHELTEDSGPSED